MRKQINIHGICKRFVLDISLVFEFPVGNHYFGYLTLSIDSWHQQYVLNVWLNQSQILKV